MRIRLLLCGLVSAAAAFAPAASAGHPFACDPEAQVVCTVAETMDHLLCGRWVTC